MSQYNPEKHHRRSIRLKGYDYSQAGAYFVTIVTQGRLLLFGEIVDGEMRLNDAGKMVQDEWERLSQRFKFVVLGTYIIMPNHFHAIIIFINVGATHKNGTNSSSGLVFVDNKAFASPDGSPLPRMNEKSPRPNGPPPASLGAILGQFKSRVTKRLWKNPKLTGVPIWQRNYYEHIIRNEEDANQIHLYIESNPTHWNDDNENPANQS